VTKFGQAGSHVPEDRRVKTIDELSALLTASQLASQEEVASLKERFGSGDTRFDLPDTVTGFCAFLVAEGVLSPWQCEKLRNGQWKGFFLDAYELLDHLGHDDHHNYYLARDAKRARFVRVIVTHSVYAKGNQFEYRIDEHLD
jgi:hypothetical protein